MSLPICKILQNISQKINHPICVCTHAQSTPQKSSFSCIRFIIFNFALFEALLKIWSMLQCEIIHTKLACFTIYFAILKRASFDAEQMWYMKILFRRCLAQKSINFWKWCVIIGKKIIFLWSKKWHVSRFLSHGRIEGGKNSFSY